MLSSIRASRVYLPLVFLFAVLTSRADTIVTDSLVTDTLATGSAGAVLADQVNEKISPIKEALSGTNFYYFIFILGLVLIIIAVLSSLNRISSEDDKKEEGEKFSNLFHNRIIELKGEASLIRKVLIYLLAIFVICYFSYFYIKGTIIESHVMEWLNLLVRWAHVVAGILWIGASFYFIFLENSLNRTRNLKKGIAGDLWAIHGGGFYYMEKYASAPEKIPEKLHWFKYEAYFTWITGFALLWIVYYMNASVYMVDPGVLNISSGTAIAIGIGTLFISWLIYDFLCKSPLAKKPLTFAIVGFLLVTAISWFLCQVLSSRAAYIHVGAMLGTLMVGNVFRVIIPSQKAMVNAAKEGKPLDPSLGKNAALRSLHNNYITLPVIFIMISIHFPSTYGNELNWAVLAGLSLASAGIKHYWNLLEKGQNAVWILPVATAMIIALAIITAPQSHEDRLKKADPVSFSEIREVFDNRCVSCHSANPTDDVWKTAPNGMMFDTPEQIVRMKDKILNRAVVTKTMPQVNKTGMLQEERDLIEVWIYQGAQVN